MTILLTRAEGDGETVKQLLADIGKECLHIPLISIHPTLLAPPVFDFTAIIITSLHGASYVSHIPNAHDYPILAVGERTASEIKKCGYSVRYTGEGTALSLISVVRNFFSKQDRFLHITGVDHKKEPGETILKEGFGYECWSAYKAQDVSTLPLKLILALKNKEISYVFHYSRRSTEILSRLVAEARLLPELQETKHIFISNDAALGAYDGGQSWLVSGRFFIARSPSESSMLDCLYSLK